MLPKSVKKLYKWALPVGVNLLVVLVVGFMVTVAPDNCASAATCFKVVSVKDSSDSLSGAKGANLLDAAFKENLTTLKQVPFYDGKKTCSRWSMLGTALEAALSTCGGCHCAFLINTDGLITHRNPFLYEREAHLFQTSLAKIGTGTNKYVFAFGTENTHATNGAWANVSATNLTSLTVQNYKPSLLSAIVPDTKNIQNITTTQAGDLATVVGDVTSSVQ